MAEAIVECVVCHLTETIQDIDDPNDFPEICYTTVGMLLYEGQIVHSACLANIIIKDSLATRIRKLEERVANLEVVINPP